ncbi:MAG: ATP-binding protein [Ruthenibacterium sp.]
MRALSIGNIEDMNHKVIPFYGAWKEAFDQPEKKGCWLIYGKSGHGKTRFCMALAKQFDEMGYKVSYLSLEEGGALNFKKAMRAAGWKRNEHHIGIIAECTVPELDDYLSKRRSPDVIFIDTIQCWEDTFGATSKEVIYLRRKYSDKIFVYISHVKENGRDVDGSMAYDVKRDAFLRIQVEGFRAIQRGRSAAGPKGYYTVWEEGAAKYYLSVPE